MKRRRKSKKVSPNFAYEIGFILFMIFLFLLGLLFQNNPGYLLIIGIFLLIGGYIIYKRVRYASICRMYENDSFEKICALQPYEFEKHCADILGLLGYSEIHLTPSHKDDGVDIWCRRNGQQFAIQCKRYSHATSVTVDQMKALYGSSQPQGAQGIMMTTGKCTLPATEFAKKNGIQIWDGEKFKSEFIHLCHTPPTFREWIKKNYI